MRFIQDNVWQRESLPPRGRWHNACYHFFRNQTFWNRWKPTNSKVERHCDGWGQANFSFLSEWYHQEHTVWQDETERTPTLSDNLRQDRFACPHPSRHLNNFNKNNVWFGAATPSPRGKASKQHKFLPSSKDKLRFVFWWWWVFTLKMPGLGFYTIL